MKIPLKYHFNPLIKTVQKLKKNMGNNVISHNQFFVFFKHQTHVSNKSLILKSKNKNLSPLSPNSNVLSHPRHLSFRFEKKKKNLFTRTVCGYTSTNKGKDFLL